MKKYISIILSLTLLAISQNSLAHGGPSHGQITESQAITVADSVAKQLAVKDAGLDIGKLSSRWASIPKENIATHKVGEGYYIISVENKAEKKTLYVLMASDGKVYDANFTGSFEGIR